MPKMEVFMAPRCRKVIIGICLFRVNVLLYDSAVADRKDYPFRVLAIRAAKKPASGVGEGRSSFWRLW